MIVEALRRAGLPLATAAPTVIYVDGQPVEKQPQSFDDMLKQFMADSDSKISGLKQYDRKTKTRRR